jgi:hypothetical protein
MSSLFGNITKHIRKDTIKLKFITGYTNSALTAKDNIQLLFMILKLCVK